MVRTSTSEDGIRDRPGFAEALGRTIKVFRTDLGMGRRELAERVGISYSYLTEIENGNKPPSSTILAPLAEALGLRMFQLIEAAEARMDALASESRPMHGEEQQRTGRPRVTQPGSPPGVRGQDYAVRPSLRGPNRDMRAALIELERLLRGMAPEDIERLLDFARRLTR
ncbi:MAG: helix-turn-helix domain-containing protein [Actinomycetia bacterium]|nr:helix-turn-helix domain-containing protein [Actinomycetes bacterium]